MMDPMLTKAVLMLVAAQMVSASNIRAGSGVSTSGGGGAPVDPSIASLDPEEQETAKQLNRMYQFVYAAHQGSIYANPTVTAPTTPPKPAAPLTTP